LLTTPKRIFESAFEEIVFDILSFSMLMWFSNPGRIVFVVVIVVIVMVVVVVDDDLVVSLRLFLVSSSAFRWSEMWRRAWRRAWRGARQVED